MFQMDNSKEPQSEIIEKIAGHYKAIIELIGEDPEREGLVKTPQRAAKALYYATRGYRQDLDSVIHGALFHTDESQLVVVKNVEFYSLCEHHVLPFFGHVSVGYLPGEKIVGLSKIARIVDMFARRLQVQERFTSELARGVIVRAEARHLCMAMRGVQKQDSTTVTLATTGAMKTDASLRAQFFSML